MVISVRLYYVLGTWNIDMSISIVSRGRGASKQSCFVFRRHWVWDADELGDGVQDGTDFCVRLLTHGWLQDRHCTVFRMQQSGKKFALSSTVACFACFACLSMCIQPHSGLQDCPSHTAISRFPQTLYKTILNSIISTKQDGQCTNNVQQARSCNNCCLRKTVSATFIILNVCS